MEKKEYYDNLSGKILPRSLVEEAMAEEIRYMTEKAKVWTKYQPTKNHSKSPNGRLPNGFW